MLETFPPAVATRPTHVRYWVVTLTTVMAVLLYLDRVCLSVVERFIKDDLRLTNFQSSLLLSAFFWTYALAQVPSGWLSDRFGARRMLTLYILSWSLLTGLMSVVHVLLALLLLRFGCGLAQAGAYPASAGLLSKWVPFSARGLASGIVSTGGRIGGFVAPVLTVYLLVAFVPEYLNSLLVPEDLLDADGLCKRLEEPGTTPSCRLSAVLRDRMPGETAQLLRQSATGLSDQQIATEESTILLVHLNEVLRQRDLIRSVNLDEYPVEQEAVTLAGVPDDQVTQPQVQRRNRLLMEAAYPGLIRQLYCLGWRPVMVVYGLAGVLVAALFWLVVRDWPRDHPSCNAQEVALIDKSRPVSATSPHGQVRGIPWGPMLRSRSLWLSSVSQFGTNFGWVFLLTLLPRYLAEVFHVPVLTRGWMASVPLLCGMTGMLAGGWVTDQLTKLLGQRWGRGLPMSMTRFVAMGAFAACTLLDSPWAVVMALSAVAIATDLGTPAAWAFLQDIGGPHVGSVLGWGNMWGNVGAALSPLVLNWIVGPGHWNACFWACAAAFLVAGIAALGIDATVPLVSPEKE